MIKTLLHTASAILNLTALAVAVSLLTGCTMLPAELASTPDAALATTSPSPEAAATAAPASGDAERPAGWSEASHSNDVDPNYDVVFPIDAVNTLTITIAPDD